MYKQFLKSGATALAGYAAKKALSGFNKSPEDKVKEAIQQFKNVVSIDVEDKNILKEAYLCFVENYPDIIIGDDEEYETSFNDYYRGSFVDLTDAAKYLLADSENSDFINSFDESEAIEITRNFDSIAVAYWDYLQDDDRSVNAYQDENGFYHIFYED